MTELLVLFALGSLTALACGLGAIPVFALADRDVHVGRLRGSGVRRSLLAFIVLLVHSLPEGFAIGTAYASDRASFPPRGLTVSQARGRRFETRRAHGRRGRRRRLVTPP